MTQGHTELRKIEVANKYFCKAESQATDMMDRLREIPGREALKLRTEVAFTASLLKQHKTAVENLMRTTSDKNF